LNFNKPKVHKRYQNVSNPIT